MNYIIEANAGLVFFYGVYYLLLRNETDFRKQRMFLLIGTLCALVAPLIEISLIVAEPIVPGGVANIAYFLPEVTVGESKSAIATSDVLLIVYILVAIAIAVPMARQCMKMYRSVRWSVGTYHNNYYIVESKHNSPSWSFFRWIYIGQSDQLSSEEKDLIVRHEMLHGKLLHSFDIILFTVLCLVFWFNPVVWIYRKTIARIHEFEVDNLVASGHNTTDYGILLAKTALSANGFLLPHYFNQSFILKRINMLNMLKRQVSSWKLTMLATTVVVYFMAVACTEMETQTAAPKEVTLPGDVPSSVSKNFLDLKMRYPNRTFTLTEITGVNVSDISSEGKGLVAMYNDDASRRSWIATEALDPKNEIFSIVEKPAEYGDGGMTGMFEFFSKTMNYPEQARSNGVQGTVFVEFIVMEDGHLTALKVLKGIGAGCDAEALRVVSKMGAWKPAENGGKPVAAKFVLPVKFMLN